MQKGSRIYLDTSVLGGCHDPEFSFWSKLLIKHFSLKIYYPVLSQTVLDEISRAPIYVQSTLSDLLDIETEILKVTDSALILAQKYISRGIVPEKFHVDALHIALASLAHVDVLVSWNFKHIVQENKIRMFNVVNTENDVKTISINSPREVTTYEK